jgi:hypothetical protein
LVISASLPAKARACSDDHPHRVKTWDPVRRTIDV